MTASLSYSLVSAQMFPNACMMSSLTVIDYLGSNRNQPRSSSRPFSCLHSSAHMAPSSTSNDSLRMNSHAVVFINSEPSSNLAWTKSKMFTMKLMIPVYFAHSDVLKLESEPSSSPCHSHFSSMSRRLFTLFIASCIASQLYSFCS